MEIPKWSKSAYFSWGQMIAALQLRDRPRSRGPRGPCSPEAWRGAAVAASTRPGAGTFNQ